MNNGAHIRWLLTPLIVFVFLIADARALTCTQLQDECAVYEGLDIFWFYVDDDTTFPSSVPTVNATLFVSS